MEKQKPSSELDNCLIDMMCKSAAAGLELQCSREYWSESEGDQRATALHNLSAEERKNLPTENLQAERYLTKFGILASESARHFNRFFKAKRIRDDLMLDDKNERETHLASVSARKVYKLMDQMETEWTIQQKAIYNQRIQDSLTKSKRVNEFVDFILKKCKEHGGPITIVVELENFLKQQGC